MTSDYSFLQYLVLILLGILFFKEELKRWFSDKLGLKSRSLDFKMDTLSQHFNHETTHLLTDILAETKKSAEHAEKAVLMLEEFKEYGIKPRR